MTGTRTLAFCLGASLCLATPLASATEGSKHGASGDDGKAIEVSQQLGYPMPGGCRYNATINGTIKKSGAADARGTTYSPDMVVTAVVSCPTGFTMKTTENIRERELGPKQVEQALERRASVMSESGRRCLYMPDLTIDGKTVRQSSVEYFCPAVAGILQRLPGGETGQGTGVEPGQPPKPQAPAQQQPSQEMQAPQQGPAPQPSQQPAPSPPRSPEGK